MENVLWFLVYAGLFYIMMRYGCGAMMHGRHGHPKESSGTKPTLERDPVCWMDVASDGGYSRVFEGRPYRFCSRECLDAFDAKPERYTKLAKSA
jgi:YHS domain-containing protein